jgi:predicted RecA/RadA family phage recombinase
LAVKGFNSVLRETFVADVAVTQFAALVQGEADYHATLPAGENAGKFVGVALDDAKPGQTVPSLLIGTVWMVAAGAIAAGDEVIIANAQGQVESASALSSGTPNPIGKALSSATAAGDLVLVKVNV